MRTLIEIHVLQNFAPSNLNRDDTGAPKDAFFGGKRRARISSQCQKKAVRNYFEKKIEDNEWAKDNLAKRTKRIMDAIVEHLVAMGHGTDEAKTKTRRALASIGISIDDDENSQYLLFIGILEIQRIAHIIHERWDFFLEEAPVAGGEKKSAKEKKKDAKNADPEFKKAVDKIFDGGKAVDIALFGRMLADMPEKNQDAACQVSHAISTHAVEQEFDFYTAIDDIKSEDNAGAGMMGTIEFNSACYYRYAVVDWEKFVANLQNDRPLAIKGLMIFIEAFVRAMPSGKQNSFAAHNFPEYVVVNVAHNTAPRNLANAFESPVLPNSDKTLTFSSAERMIKKAMLLDKAYGQVGKRFVLSAMPSNPDMLNNGHKVDSLDSLISNICDDLKE